MSATRPQFSIDDAFELTLENVGPGPESSGVPRFGPLHFERWAQFEVAVEDKQSRLATGTWKMMRMESRPLRSLMGSQHQGFCSSPWSSSTISSSTQSSYNACCSWTQHPLIQKNRRVVLASFLLLLLGLVPILVGAGLKVAPSPGISSAIFFMPGILLLGRGVYHVIFIYRAVKGRWASDSRLPALL